MRARPSGALAGLVALLLAGCTPAAPLPPPAPRPAESGPPPAPPPGPAEAPAKPCAPLAVPALKRASGPLDPALVDIEDEHGALAAFYGKLVALLQGSRKEPLRVLVYGDSNLAADWLTGGLRRTLQEALGDGGHGFVALGRPWPGYSHMDVKLEAAGTGWEVFAVSTRPVADMRLGFGGIAVQSRLAGVKVAVATAGAAAPVGRTASRVGVHYLRGPGQGSFEIRIDGEKRQVVDASATDYAAGLAVVEVEDAPHRVQLLTLNKHPLRLFGATLERAVPGVVVDTVGVASSITGTLMRQERATYRQALDQRGHDLVIMTHGTFDVKPWSTAEDHAKNVRAMVTLHREVRPDVGVLITSPIDYRGPLSDSRYSPAVAAAENHAIARENRVAFWDLRAAMGGDRSIARFHQHRLAEHDHIHLNEKGGLFMGNRLALALWSGLARHLDQHPACAPP